MFSAILLARTQLYVRSYTYESTMLDNKKTARVNAINQLKADILNEISEVIIHKQHYKNVDGKDKYTEDIKIYAMGTIEKIQIVDESWDGHNYTVTANVHVDPEDVEKKLDRILNNEKMKRELEKEKEKSDKLIAENIKLKKDFQNNPNRILAYKYIYQQNINSFIANSSDQDKPLCDWLQTLR